MKKKSRQADSFFGLASIQFGEKAIRVPKEGYVVKSNGKQDGEKRRILKSSGNEAAALVDLEEMEAEVKEVYQLFEEQGKEAIALFYDQANKKNLQEHIGTYKYVLISTHGFLQQAGKNTLSGIHLASQQMVDDEGQTEEEGQSDDYILHTSLFKVPQDSTSLLTQALFRYILEGDTYATALRKAKLDLIGDEIMEPMDWAGFALVGG